MRTALRGAAATGWGSPSPQVKKGVCGISRLQVCALSVGRLLRLLLLRTDGFHSAEADHRNQELSFQPKGIPHTVCVTAV